MNNKKMQFIGSLLTFMIVAWTISCSGRSGKPAIKPGAAVENVNTAPAPRLISMISPAENAEYKLGSGIDIVIEGSNRNNGPDSVILSFDGIKLVSLPAAPWKYMVNPELLKSTGRKPVKAAAWKNGRQVTVVTRFVIVMSDIIPKRYGYKVVNTYPHDRDAYTQGLFYADGLLYEGTGQETRSSLREVEIETGKIKRQLNLSPELFGEGITLYKDRIYQVTYTTKVGFLYDRASFKQINKFYYQTEGWGLTTINDRLVMSDGSNILYYIDPEMFTVVSRLEVYDNEKKVDQLNELEYINGEIWSNIWMTDLIARIDPESGKVLGYINMKGILKDPGTDTAVDVLNGIAWDPQGKRIFVTGKNWPKLFEIRITE